MMQTFQDNTFSIVARNPLTGELAVGVCTARLAVGNRVPFVLAGAGAVATQADTNPTLGREAISLLRAGIGAEEALRRALAKDAGREKRQLAVIDHTGGMAPYTGETVHNENPWAGTLAGNDCLAAGNLLANGDVLAAMVAAYERTYGFIGHRVLRALEEGQAAGGDKRGKESAALLCARTGPHPVLDLRIDMSHDPLLDLRRLYAAYTRAFPVE